jgi:hypothetical protein
MSRIQLKLGVLSALRADPDFSQLQLLNAVSQNEMRRFLRWLDHSGLALYLVWRLRTSNELENAPSRLRVELQRRLESNRRRTEVMLSEFRNVSECFRDRHISHAFLKGLTLAPEFCPAPDLRHQTDLDVLISPERLEEARAAILACGYSLERTKRAGETHFSTPLARIPSADDDIYATDYQREIELHTSVWEGTGHVSFEVAVDCLDRTRLRRIRGIDFTSLSLEDTFLLQTLHVFRHLLGSWVRLSWLWEIHYFIVSRSRDARLWLAIRDRGGDDPVLKNALGLILRLTNQLFASPIPRTLREWCVDTLPDRLKCWVAKFGIRWALSDISSSKLTLFVHKEFIREANLWRAYLWRRMFPFGGRPSLGEIDPANRATQIKFQIRQRLFQAGRLAFHVCSLVSFSFEALRWKHALIQTGSNGRWLVAKGPNRAS